MSMFCKNCGTEISDGAPFCTECGTPISDAAPQPAPTPSPQPAPQPQQYNTYVPPAGVAVGTDNTVSTGSFFGHMFLFSIPIVGWIFCIIIAFSSKNPNKKNFAKAMLIWLLIAIVISAILCAVIFWVGNMITDYVNEALGEEFGGFTEFFDQLNELQEMDLEIPPEMMEEQPQE